MIGVPTARSVRFATFTRGNVVGAACVWDEAGGLRTERRMDPAAPAARRPEATTATFRKVRFESSPGASGDGPLEPPGASPSPATLTPSVRARASLLFLLSEG